MTTARSDFPQSNRSFMRRLRSRSPLNSSRFWQWAIVVVAAAFVFDAIRMTTPALGADDKTAAKTGNDSKTDRKSNGEPAGHSDPVAPVLLAIVVILFLAKTTGDLFERYGLPAVLGELAIGIVLGNLTLIGIDALDPLFRLPEFESKEFIARFLHDPEHVAYNPAIALKILAGIGVILLLFEVGLESTVREMMSVGTSSLLVALLGVVAPMGLGWWVSSLLIPDAGWQVHAFIGATLCATSVGITARVLKDLGRSQQRESQIILGAAVIDDVLGLIVLAVISGIIAQGSVELGSMAWIVGKSIGFLVAAIVLGTLLVARPLFRAASYLRGHGMLVATALVICFGFSWLANFVGLAPIVGAFAAGLILEKTHYRELGRREDYTLEKALAPLAAMLVPIFFVQMGTQVDLASFGDSSVWLLAGAITLVAILGKQACSFGVLEKGLNKFAVGLGMIPRGEVGLIFAGVGKDLKMPGGDPVIDDPTFSAVVVMVMITTMVTPPLLKWSLTRGDAGEPGEEPEE